MDFFGYIGFIDWVNGKVNVDYRCHLHEEVKIEQILNLIGVTSHAFFRFYKALEAKA